MSNKELDVTFDEDGRLIIGDMTPEESMAVLVSIFTGMEEKQD